jgi:hypothetical protein
MKRSSFIFAFAATGALGAVFAACSGSTETTTGSTATVSASVSASSASASGSGGAASVASSASSGGKGGGGGGIGGAGGAGGQGGAGGTACMALGDACSNCSFASCNATYCTCEADSECAGLVLCILPCAGDDSCTEACYVAHGKAIAPAVLVGSCANMNCKAECPGSLQLVPCEICTAQQCPDELNACYGDAACAAIVQCVRNDCADGDTMCDLKCITANPSGLTEVEALRTCAEAKCPVDCANF